MNPSFATAFNRGMCYVTQIGIESWLTRPYYEGGRWKDAGKLQVSVMETNKRVLGENHSVTLTSMSDLASTYWSQGRQKEAEELRVQVMEMKKRVFGEDHPHTLTSMLHLASSFSSQGRHKEAEE
jgi:hypothetical protein